jgi:hypothetical protein
MVISIFMILFVTGALFINASHIPAWFLGNEKPTHPNWKFYGFVGITIWILILILANIIL